MSISGLESIKNFTVQYINQPEVKEIIKKTIGVATFTFGLYETYNVLTGHRNIVDSLGSLSVVLSATVSKPGIAIISKIHEHIFSKEQSEKIFGPNTIFAINPYHPRHTVSIAALVLGTAGVVTPDRHLLQVLLFNILTCRPLLHIVNQHAMAN